MSKSSSRLARVLVSLMKVKLKLTFRVSRFLRLSFWRLSTKAEFAKTILSRCRRISALLLWNSAVASPKLKVSWIVVVEVVTVVTDVAVAVSVVVTVAVSVALAVSVAVTVAVAVVVVVVGWVVVESVVSVAVVVVMATSITANEEY